MAPCANISFEVMIDITMKYNHFNIMANSLMLNLLALLVSRGSTRRRDLMGREDDVHVAPHPLNLKLAISRADNMSPQD